MEEGWERPPRIDLADDELAALLAPAFPGATISESAVLASGLANTNIRLRLAGHPREYVLRLHTRDRAAALRERAVMRYLAENPRSFIPVPALVYSDPAPERGVHPYSIWELVEGALLQDLFTTLPPEELVEIAAACGRVLAGFCAHRFPTCGAFGEGFGRGPIEGSKGLAIVEAYGAPSRFVPEVVEDALFRGRVGERLGVELRDALWASVERAAPLLATIDGTYTLVHADYKRSNILVQRVAGAWTVAAVLDWEFACAAPPLIDVGLFLRAGERLPAGFRDAFVAAYASAGGLLPAEWLRLSRLLDLVSQMTFLNHPAERPRVVAETTEVVRETLRVLS